MEAKFSRKCEEERKSKWVRKEEGKLEEKEGM
jgi:hypothetical protein